MGRINEAAQSMFNKKQESIAKISESKDIGMTFSNALNNSVAVWSVLAEHQEIDVKEALEDISGLVEFFRNMKEGVKAEMTSRNPGLEAFEKVVTATEKEFLESTVTTPIPRAVSQEQIPPPIPTPAYKATVPQIKKIFVELNKKKYDKAKHVEILNKMFNMTIKSLNDLNKSTASDIIKRLIEMGGSN